MSRDLDVEFIVDDGRGERIVGTLALPNEASALVLFAHGGGSSRLSPRNQFVAEVLRRGGFGTLLLDLLTPDEQRSEEATARVRFDVARLAARIGAATDWLTRQRVLPAAPIGYFGASTGVAAALMAAAKRPATVGAVVSRGGRPEFASGILADVRAPTLFIVGQKDPEVLAVNEAAWHALGARHRDLRIIPGASHLFEEPGALDEVAEIAREWFEQFLMIQPAAQPAVPPPG
jgi:dienelactone hydrolase